MPLIISILAMKLLVAGPCWEHEMMTVITTTTLKHGAEQEWDAAIKERFQSAHNRPGWVSGQLLTPLEAPDVRTIVGTWHDKDQWEAWHHDPAFVDQRSRLEALEAEPSTTAWYTVVADAQTKLG
jgi:heme-degrading monooxygenase HmoA